MSEPHVNTCKNCGVTIIGNYCENCGQKAKIGKVTFQETFQDIFNAIFAIDAPFITTLKMLIINPGRIFNEYLHGKRRKYYKPVTFFILMTVVYLVIRGIINYDPFGDTMLQVQDPSDSQILTKARNFMLLNIDKLLFVFVFSLGLFMKLFFYKKNTLAEFLAISFFLLGIYTILTTLNMFYIKYLNSKTQGLGIALMLLYFIYAMVTYFPLNKILVIIKSLIVFVLAFFFYGMTAYGISLLIIWVKYH